MKIETYILIGAAATVDGFADSFLFYWRKLSPTQTYIRKAKQIGLWKWLNAILPIYDPWHRAVLLRTFFLSLAFGVETNSFAVVALVWFSYSVSKIVTLNINRRL